MPFKTKTPKPPRKMWADFDPSYPSGSKWSFYATKKEQRSIRPDLKPIKVIVLEA